MKSGGRTGSMAAAATGVAAALVAAAARESATRIDRCRRRLRLGCGPAAMPKLVMTRIAAARSR